MTEPAPTDPAPTDPAPTDPASALLALPVTGIGEVRAGDDLAALIEANVELRDGDVLVVSSKVVSKAEGRFAADRTAAIAAETVRVVAERQTARGEARIVESRSGPVLAAAGVDVSNVPAGTVLLLPADPDSSARRLRAALARRTGRRLGVVISDTAGRPWREGQTDLAIGVAGVQLVDDLRGAVDGSGQPLEVTVRALVDEIAGMADLVKGKLAAVPVAVVRGLPVVAADPGSGGDGPGAAALLRRPQDDWFRYGHLEAVRAALGVPAGAPVPLATAPPGDAWDRLGRAVAVAVAGPALFGGDRPAIEVRPGAGTVTLVGADVGELVALAQRVVTAARAEDLTVRATRLPDAIRLEVAAG